jgi:hypothetical protein
MPEQLTPKQSVLHYFTAADAEWRKLSAADKEQLKNGLVSGSLTY